ncbi:MAG: hypothetical protein Q9178_006770 [Gyalolechia marmorata]
MAEVAATIAIVASIASLLDISAKVVSRLHEFSSRTSDVPGSLQSLSVRLPLLIATIKRIQTHARLGHLVIDDGEALAAVIINTTKHLTAVQAVLSKVLPPNGASKLERALNALKSLAKDDNVQNAMREIHKNMDTLLLHQTVHHVDTGTHILEQLSKLTINPKPTLVPVGIDETLSLAPSFMQTARDGSPLSGSKSLCMLPYGNREYLYRFSQLPLAVQEQYLAQQEEQLIRFVEQQEARVIEFFRVFDTRDFKERDGLCRLGSCDWILVNEYFPGLSHSNSDQSLLTELSGAGSFAEVSKDGTTNGDILAFFSCSRQRPETRLLKSLLCALAGQIARNSPASMEKATSFFKRHISDSHLEPKLQDLQDLIVEMSLSTDINRIFIVIDGLDEGEWEQIGEVKAVIDIPNYARKVKMLITCRREALIVDALCKYTSLSIDDAYMAEFLAGKMLYHYLNDRLIASLAEGLRRSWGAGFN